MPPPSGAEMPHHDVNMTLMMDMGQTHRALEDLNTQMDTLSGTSGEFHRKFLKDQFSANSLGKEMNQQIGMQIIRWKQSIAQLNAWNLGIAALTQAASDIGELQKATEYMRVSAALTTKSFEELQKGIIQTSTITGQSIGEIAQKARSIYDLTGLTEGLDQVIVAGSHMNRVFGMAGEEFEKFAAFGVKFSGGMTDANTLMSKFDKVVGLTGAKMSDLLTTLGAISKSLFKIIGGGKNFASVLEGATEFIANASSQMQKMGGDSDFIGDLTNTILDTNRWSELNETMPMFAAHAYEMQEAFTSGDMEKFHKLIQASAKETLSMSDGMNAAAKSKMGIPVGDLTVLAGLDFKNLGAGADQAETMGDVMSRSTALMMNIGDSITRLWRNFSAVITKILLPLFEQISAGLAAVNDSLSRNQAGASSIIEMLTMLASGIGWVLKFVLELTAAFIDWTGSTGAVVAGIFGILIAWKAFMWILAGSVKIVSWMFGPVLQAAATGVAAAAQTTAIGVASASKTLGTASKSMMKAGIGLAFMAGALILFAVAFSMMSGVDMLGISLGLTVLLVTMTALGFAAGYIWPLALMFSAVAAIFAVGIGALGIALWLFGGQLETFGKQSKAIGEIANSLTKLQDLAGVVVDTDTWVALVKVGKILKGMPKIDVSVADSMANLAEVMTTLGNNIDDIVKTSKKVQNNTKALQDVMTTLFDPKDGFLTKAAKDINKTFSVDWGFDIDITKPLENMKELLNFFNALRESIVPLIAIAQVFDESGGDFAVDLWNMMLDLFSEDDGFLIMAVKQIDEGFTSGINLAVEGPIKSMNQLLSFFESLGNILPRMIAISEMFDADGNIGVRLWNMMFALFGADDGFMVLAVELIDEAFTKWTNLAVDGPIKSMNQLMKFFGALRKQIPDMVAMSQIFDANGDVGVRLWNMMFTLFGKEAGFIPLAMRLIDNNMPAGNGVAGKLKSANALISGIADLSSNIANVMDTQAKDVSMKVEGAAAQAFVEFQTAQREHEEKVEDLLGEIRDLLRNGQVTAVASSSGGGGGSGLSLGDVFGEDDGWG